MSEIWTFLTDPTNRDVLAWLGGGLVIVACGVWAVFKFFRKGVDAKSPSIHVTADRGGVAGGRDVHVTGHDPRPKAD